ncbi:MAG TPA: ParB/RepB/Spo0J family partition protein [Gemmatimonadaceae bacterium]|nr:ParB/RepB/Spo0J family partition protein [Gemmatimonadaceae bacterium]
MPVAPASPSPSAPESQEPFRQLRLDQIVPNPKQPRREFSESELQELQLSLQTSGLLQPIAVRPRGDGRFELIAGERRFRAASRLGWTTIPAVIRDVSDEQLLSLALVENLQREDLNPIEEAQGYRQLINEFGLAHQQVAQAVGKDRSTVTNALRLLSLPDEVQHLVRDGSLTLGHARALLGVPPGISLSELARKVVAQRLSVREVERLVQEAKPTVKRNRDAENQLTVSEVPEVRRLTDRLRRFLQTDVAVHVDSAGRGEVRIRFYSADDFNRVFELMTRSSKDAD